MKTLKSALKWIVPRILVRKVREVTAYWRSRGHDDPGKASNSLGDVSPHWRKRIDDVLACPDNLHIPRVARAGELENGLVIMHNGIRVSALGYYGSGVLNMLVENRGVHEPQEERAFAEILRHIPPGGSIVELGAYWGFYSLWFAEVVAQAKCFLIEPMDENIRAGMMNFGRTGHRAVFERASIGAMDGISHDLTPQVTVDSFCGKNGIDRLSILHSDIQGAEAEMLRGARSMLAENRIDYVFISTHANALHYECIDVLKSHDYVILASADLDETYSYDGLIVAKCRTVENPRELPISHRPHAETTAEASANAGGVSGMAGH